MKANDKAQEDVPPLSPWEIETARAILVRRIKIKEPSFILDFDYLVDKIFFGDVAKSRYFLKVESESGKSFVSIYTAPIGEGVEYITHFIYVPLELKEEAILSLEQEGVPGYWEWLPIEIKKYFDVKADVKEDKNDLPK